MRALPAVAWSSAVAHVGALAIVGITLTPALQGPEIARRAAHVATHPVGWLAAWSTFTAAGVLLVVFYVLLARTLARRGGGGGARLGIALVVAGLLVDVSGHATSVLLVSDAARRGDLVAFASLESLVRLLTTTVPQPLFGLGMLVFVRLLVSVRAPLVTLVAGGINVASAFLASATAALGWAALTPVAIATVVLSLAVFQVSLARADRPDPSVR